MLFDKNKLELIQFPISYKQTEYTIPNSVTSIGSSAFDGCSGLTSIAIPNSVTSIGYYAFQYCSGLKEIYNNSKTPLDVDYWTFYDVDKTTCILYVPKGSLEAYRATDYWRNFANIQEFDVTGIESSHNDKIEIAFNGNEIMVKGASDAEPVTLYTMNGTLVYSGTSKSVAVPANGVYIVKVAGVTKKVSL